MDEKDRDDEPERPPLLRAAEVLPALILFLLGIVWLVIAFHR